MVDRQVLAEKIASGAPLRRARLEPSHEIASTRLDDLLAFCEAPARRTSE
jgi:hypothetical protein